MCGPSRVTTGADSIGQGCCRMCSTDTMELSDGYRKFVCVACRKMDHRVCTVHQRISCTKCMEYVAVRWCSRGHHFVSLSFFVDSLTVCYLCSWRWSSHRQVVTRVLQRRDATVRIEGDQRLPIVQKRITGKQASRELDLHKQAAALHSAHVLPILRTKSDSLFLPYVQPLAFRECCARRRVKSYMKQLVQGLNDLHSHGIIHCDVKPDNILMSRRTGKVMIIDFGLAAAMGDGTLRTSIDRLLVAGRGTPGYRAPEVLANIRPCSAASDMWAVGIVLMCLIRKQLPGHMDPTAEANNMCKLVGTNVWQSMVNNSPWRDVPVKHFPTPSTTTDWRRLCRGRGTPEALSLLGLLLQPEPLRRLTAEQCAMHPFMSS